MFIWGHIIFLSFFFSLSLPSWAGTHDSQSSQPVSVSNEDSFVKDHCTPSSDGKFDGSTNSLECMEITIRNIMAFYEDLQHKKSTDGNQLPVGVVDDLETIDRLETVTKKLLEDSGINSEDLLKRIKVLEDEFEKVPSGSKDQAEKEKEIQTKIAKIITQALDEAQSKLGEDDGERIALFERRRKALEGAFVAKMGYGNLKKNTLEAQQNLPTNPKPPTAVSPNPSFESLKPFASLPPSLAALTEKPSSPPLIPDALTSSPQKADSKPSSIGPTLVRPFGVDIFNNTAQKPSSPVKEPLKPSAQGEEQTPPKKPETKPLPKESSSPIAKEELCPGCENSAKTDSSPTEAKTVSNTQTNKTPTQTSGGQKNLLDTLKKSIGSSDSVKRHASSDEENARNGEREGYVSAPRTPTAQSKLADPGSVVRPSGSGTFSAQTSVSSAASAGPSSFKTLDDDFFKTSLNEVTPLNTVTSLGQGTLKTPTGMDDIQILTAAEKSLGGLTPEGIKERTGEEPTSIARRNISEEKSTEVQGATLFEAPVSSMRKGTAGSAITKNIRPATSDFSESSPSGSVSFEVSAGKESRRKTKKPETENSFEDENVWTPNAVKLTPGVALPPVEEIEPGPSFIPSYAATTRSVKSVPQTETGIPAITGEVTEAVQPGVLTSILGTFGVKMAPPMTKLIGKSGETLSDLFKQLEKITKEKRR